MIKLTVDKLTPGMVLGQDIVRQDGVVLMAKGREITDDVKNMLYRLDIDSVVVEGDFFASEEERLAHMAGQEAALEMRFSRVSDDPILMAIKEMFRRNIRGERRPEPPEQDEPAAASAENAAGPNDNPKKES